MKVRYYSGNVYKVGKKQHPATASRVDEWIGVGGGEAMVVGSNPVTSMNFFFFLFCSQKSSKFFGGLVAGTRSRKFPVPVPVL